MTHQDSSTEDANQETILPFTIGANFAWLIAQVHTAELPWFFQLLEPVDARAARCSRVQLKCLGFSTSWSPSTRAQHVPCADHRVTPKVLKWRNWGVEGTPNLNVEILN